MNKSIVEAFHAVSRLHRADLFDSDSLMPISATEDANTPAAGWVGSHWSGGTLLVGINPGGGGDDYRRNPTDAELYKLLRALAAAGDENEAEQALARVSVTWQRLQRTHNIWRIIEPILNATGEQLNDIAFLNILPFRTRMDRSAPVAVLRRAWSQASGRQLVALRPRRVIALGKKAWNALSRFPLAQGVDLILFKRGIGDSYIPVESQAVLRSLAHERDALRTRTSND